MRDEKLQRLRRDFDVGEKVLRGEPVGQCRGFVRRRSGGRGLGGLGGGVGVGDTMAGGLWRALAGRLRHGRGLGFALLSRRGLPHRRVALFVLRLNQWPRD